MPFIYLHFTMLADNTCFLTKISPFFDGNTYR
jgi:hypothetical protein